MRRRFIDLLRRLWLQAGLLVGALVFLEVAASLYIRWSPAFRGNPAQFIKPFHPDAGEQPPVWMDAYLAEAALLPPVLWHPYSYWISAPFQGAFFNVNGAGLRATWSPPSRACSRRQRIFVFGGSTVWGTYARDDYTIPSFIAKKLDECGAEVTNFGQGGYVSTQELLLLQEQLRKGNLPDVVVFYDGVNDTLSALENRRAGVSEEELLLAQDFASSGLSRLLVWAARNSSIGIVTRNLLRESSNSKFNQMRVAMQEKIGLRAQPIDHWKRGILDDYFGNIRMVRALARDFGFRTLFVWQPVIWSKIDLTGEESRISAKTERRLPGIASLYRDVYREISQRAQEEGILDLASVLDNGGRYFVDFCHLTEAGNDKVAEAIVPALEKALQTPSSER